MNGFEMTKYRFRLQTLKRVRETRRNERLLELAEAIRAEEVLTTSAAQLDAETAELREFQRMAAVGSYADVNRLLEAQRYELVLKARKQELSKQSMLLAAEIERRRQALIEADREMRVLERLEHRRRREHDQILASREIKQLDEAALTIRYHK